MGSLTTSKIPVIDFSMKDLRPGTDSWCSVRTEVRQALEEYGCFEAVCGDFQFQKAMLDALKQLYDLPLETRRKHPANDRNKGGNPYTPLFENVGLLDALDLEKLQSFTNLMWSEGNPSFCETVYAYITRASKMEQMVKRMVFESFGAEKYYDSYVKQTTYTLRANKYRPPMENETNLGLNVHTDSGFISVLSQNDVNGLEIQTKDGEWISVTPSPSSFVVIAADALYAWSNARLHSPHHRVMMNVEKTRYAIAFFSFCKGIVQTPEELVDEEHPLLFKPFSHMGFRQFIISQGEYKSKSPIKAYCGV
ncbi:hypothetical protein AQUCO_01400780v1 [Aquilegia coerulea]|uniref:Fe2OG dioxygenase domain-containing protein n=1 Tax=Aquilegia coerulea TaxID=218851 RepID=A0A2G5DYS8_AQUCA|nr:hypothetical protein AQUCO_01400780v1 [Aquilegia coerulea]